MDYRLRPATRSDLDALVAHFEDTPGNVVTVDEQKLSEIGVQKIESLTKSRVVYIALRDHNIDISKEGVDIVLTKREPEVDERVMFEQEYDPMAMNRKDHQFYFPRVTSLVELDILHDRVVWLTGPTGCGKTTMLELVARKNRMHYFRCSVRTGIEDHNIVGEKTLEHSEKDGQVVVAFIRKVLLRAMTQGLGPSGKIYRYSASNPKTWPGLLVLEEADSIEPTLAFLFHEVLEPPVKSGKFRRRRFTVDQDRGQVLLAHPGFRIAACANTKGRGALEQVDTMFGGTQEQNAAFLNRFTSMWELGYHIEGEASLVKELIGDTPAAKKLIEFRNGVREVIRTESMRCFFTTRDLEEICEKFVYVCQRFSYTPVYDGTQSPDPNSVTFDPMGLAVLSTFINTLSSTEKVAFYNVFQRVFSVDLHQQHDRLLDDMQVMS